MQVGEAVRFPSSRRTRANERISGFRRGVPGGTHLRPAPHLQCPGVSGRERHPHAHVKAPPALDAWSPLARIRRTSAAETLHESRDPAFADRTRHPGKPPGSVENSRFPSDPQERPARRPYSTRTMSLATDFPISSTIREGHEELLATFREFALDFDSAEDRLPDPDTVRATISFLRQGLLPFARLEERHPGGCAEVVEDTAFEHAFLTVEIDALVSAVSGLGSPVGPDRAAHARRIRRCVHRIEAVLELHVQKEQDREPFLESQREESAAIREQRPNGVREMDPAEARRFLRLHEWGVLGTVGRGTPYGVPVSYGFDGRDLFVASGPGLKRRNLETNPAVCITVAEVVDGDHWRSVVVTGDARPVDDLRGKLHALNAIRRQRVSGALPSAADLARAARAAIFRVPAERITGRERG
jgi:uncharacterized protein